jgi:hypothetical protein
MTFHISKNLELISIAENPTRCRSGHIYEARMKNHIEQELFFLIDFNHELDTREMIFKKRQDWDYNKWPIEYSVLGIVGNGNHTDELYAYFNGIYQKQERDWRK